MRGGALAGLLQLYRSASPATKLVCQKCRCQGFLCRRSALLERVLSWRPRVPMPNIYDVAKRARVSVATVSAVLNDSAFVSQTLKARVQSAVDQLGYEPNLVARSLAKQRTHTLGMVVPDISNPFFTEVVRGAEDAAHAAGYT